RLTEVMLNTAAKPADVAAAAKSTAKDLDDWLTRLKAAPLTAEQVRVLVRALVDDPLGPGDWDHAAQHYLALVALTAGLGEMDPAFKDAKFREPLSQLRSR